jgi:hypothetical protein
MKGVDKVALPLLFVGFVAWWLFFKDGLVQLKNGVTLNGVKGPMLFALGVAKTVYATFGSDLVVTSTTDGEHAGDGSGNSLHPSGLAADLRTHDFTAAIATNVATALRTILSPFGFDVVLESDHIHVEYDPKAGRSLFGLPGRA